jgi:hypothetical protein
VKKGVYFDFDLKGHYLQNNGSPVNIDEITKVIYISPNKSIDPINEVDIGL